MKTWHERLKDAIEARAVTKLALAKHVGIKAPSVSAWLSAKSKTMSAEHAIAVCAFLGITQEWLFLGKGSIDEVKKDSHKRKVLSQLTSDLPEFAMDEAIRRITDIKEFVETVKKNTAADQ
ncbi:MAG TPA: helix-turn-helix transcriptional regulator [Methylotenera sp.]|nr:helix-turn-helix transcriptional regulator [Methylotenera sp.]HPN01008.1 helix-turn-helix transcriptional regulator [Methylotenera sp.]